MLLFALSVVSTMSLVGAASCFLSWRHTGSTEDFRDTEAYYAERKRRDRFFREEHLGIALLVGALIGGLNAYWLNETPIPAWSAMLAFAVLWPLWTYVLRRPKNQMRMYDKQDMANVGSSLLGGIMTGLLVAIASGGGGSPLVVALLVAAFSWLLLFPL